MQLNAESVRQEYRLLSQATPPRRQDADLHQSAIAPQNRNKNRYPDVLPVEDTRVRLQPIGNVPGSDYINANIVHHEHKFEAICSQAPLPNTFDDFWRMVWEQDVPIIVILMRLRENGKVKGHHYWPTSSNKPKQYGDITISLKKAKQVEQTRVRVFQLTKTFGHGLTAHTSSRRIVQLHFKGWPDQGVPDSTRPIRELVHLMQFYRQKAAERSLRGPVLVHCSAGIGRTGTFLAIVFSLEKMNELSQQQGTMRNGKRSNPSRKTNNNNNSNSNNPNLLHPNRGDSDDTSSSASNVTSDATNTNSSDVEGLKIPERHTNAGSEDEDDANNTNIPIIRGTRGLRRSSSDTRLRSPRSKAELPHSGAALGAFMTSELDSSEEEFVEEDKRRLRESSGNTNKVMDKLPVSIMEIVLSLRRQRNRGMVQTEDQYQFIYKAVLDELAKNKIELSTAVLEFMDKSVNDIGIFSLRSSSSGAKTLHIQRSRSQKGLSKSAELVKSVSDTNMRASYGGYSTSPPGDPFSSSAISVPNSARQNRKSIGHSPKGRSDAMTISRASSHELESSDGELADYEDRMDVVDPSMDIQQLSLSESPASSGRKVRLNSIGTPLPNDYPF